MSLLSYPFYFLFISVTLGALLQSNIFLPIKSFTLRTECEKLIAFDDIFTKPELYNALFSNVYQDGYYYALGMLGLFSLSTQIPIQSLQERFSQKIKYLLDYPIFSSSKFYQLEEEEEMRELITKYLPLENIRECTIGQVLEHKDLFRAISLRSDLFLSLPFTKILAIHKLNSFDNQPSNGFFTLLDSPHYLPYLLRLPRFNFEDIDLISLLKISPSAISLLPDRVNHPSVSNVEFMLDSPLATLYHLYPEAFSKIAAYYQTNNISELIARLRPEWPAEFQSEFNPTTPLVILPYKPLEYPYACISTGNSLQLYTGASSAKIQLSLTTDNILRIDKVRCPCYHIFRIHRGIEYVATSLPHEEETEPGVLYAISMDVINQYELDKLFKSIQDVEFLVDAMVDRGFCILSICKSQQN